MFGAPQGPDPRADIVRAYRPVEELIPAEWTSQYVEHGGRRLHVRRHAAPGKPALLLLHGLSESSLAWITLAGELAGRYDLILPDARGHGLSEGEPVSLAAVELADDAVAVLDALGIARAAVVGDSMGGGQAAQLAADYPERIVCIALGDPAWAEAGTPGVMERPGFEEFQRRWNEWLRSLKVSPHEERMISALQWSMPGLPLAAERDYVAWVEALRLIGETTFSAMTGPPSRPQAVWQELVPAITCPLLLLVGDPALGSATTPETGRRLAAERPNVRLVHLPGVGHLLRWGAYEPYRDAITAFLAAHAGG